MTIEFGHHSMNLVFKAKQINLKIYLPRLHHRAIREFKVLQILHNHGLCVPRPMKLMNASNCSILIREYVEGMAFHEALDKLDAESLRKVLTSLIEQIHMIENLGIYIPEFTSLSKNVVVKRDKPYIIDLERALFRKKPIVTQLLGLIIKLSKNPKLYRKLSQIIKLEEIKSAAKVYRETNDIKAIRNIFV